MTVEEKLAICTTCKNREFDRQTGMICSLTHQKPSFESICKDFIRDPGVSYVAAESGGLGGYVDEPSPSSYGGIIWGALLLITGIILTFVSNSMNIGLIVVGIVRIVVSLTR